VVSFFRPQRVQPQSYSKIGADFRSAFSASATQFQRLRFKPRGQVIASMTASIKSWAAKTLQEIHAIA
jgi:hypothetical protein